MASEHTNVPATMDEAAAWVAHTRSARQQLIDSVAKGQLDLSAALEATEGQPSLETLKLLPLLEAAPGAGKVKTRRALASVGIPLDTIIADLNEQQLAEVATLQA